MPPVLLSAAPARPQPRIVVAPRLPVRPREHTGNVFTTEGDIVATCTNCAAEGGKVYQVMGPRDLVKKALDEHRKLFHSQEIGVVLLNQPGQ